MTQVHYIRVAALNRCQASVRTSLIRLRNARLQHHDQKPQEAMHPGLMNELCQIQDELNELATSLGDLPSPDDEVSRLLALAHQISRDCDEILRLIG